MNRIVRDKAIERVKLYQRLVKEHDFNWVVEDFDEVKDAIKTAYRENMLPELFELIRRTYDIFSMKGLTSEGDEYLTKLVENFKTTNDKRSELLTVNMLTWVLWNGGYLKEARKIAEEYEQVLKQTQDKKVLAQGLQSLAGLSWVEGNYSEAKNNLVQALQIVNEMGQGATLAVLNSLASTCYYLREFEEAKKYTEEALGIATHMQARYETAAIILIKGTLHQIKRSFEEAEESYWDAIAIFEALKFKQGLGDAYVNLGMLALLKESYDDAETYFQEALIILEGGVSPQKTATCNASLGYIEILQNRFSIAKKYFVNAFTLRFDEPVLEALTGVAHMAVAQRDYHLASTLVGLIQHHPATNPEDYEIIQELYQTLKEKLAWQDLEAALENGSQIELYSMVEQLEQEWAKEESS